MSENQIKSKTHKKFKACTTNSNHKFPIAPRVCKTEDVPVAVMAADQVWVSDITYIEIAEGWLYLAIFLEPVDLSGIVKHYTEDAKTQGDVEFL